MAPSALAAALLGALGQQKVLAQPTMDAGNAALPGTWRTPSKVRGDCTVVWNSHFAKYFMPYTATFGDSGSFTWTAPYKDGSATEVGMGQYLSPPIKTERADGSWEAHYFSANRFTPSPDHSTLCCCEYVGGKGSGHPVVLADYLVATVPNSADRPLAEVCAPFMQQCPLSNASALEMLGDPFIEVYSQCSAPGLLPLTSDVTPLAVLIFPVGLVLAGLVAMHAYKACNICNPADKIDTASEAYAPLPDRAEEAAPAGKVPVYPTFSHKDFGKECKIGEASWNMPPMSRSTTASTVASSADYLESLLMQSRQQSEAFSDTSFLLQSRQQSEAVSEV